MNRISQMPERSAIMEAWAVITNLLALYGSNLLAWLAAAIVGFCRAKLEGQPLPVAIMGAVIVGIIAMTMQPVIIAVGFPADWYIFLATVLAYLGPATLGQLLTRVVTSRVRAFVEPPRDE